MSKKVVGSVGCVTVLLIVALNLAIGGWSVDEILSWFGKDVPAVVDMLIGLFVGEFTIPVAIIGKILIALGLV